MSIGVMEAGTVNHNDHENVRLSKLTEISRGQWSFPTKRNGIWDFNHFYINLKRRITLAVKLDTDKISKYYLRHIANTFYNVKSRAAFVKLQTSFCST